MQAGNASNVWTLSGNHIYYDEGNVGIGTTAPTALIHAYGTGIGEGNVLFAGGLKLTNPGEPPVSGTGTRMMWYPDKAAFRAGYVNGDHWDQGNTGFFSVAAGYATTASGDYSTAMGRNTTASGTFSTALGFYTVAPSYMETALGRYTIEYSPTGTDTWIDTDRLFAIGNGASFTQRNNALTILKNGNTGLGTENPTALLHTYGTDIGEGNVLFVGDCKYTEKNAGAPPTSGEGTRMMWYPDKAAFRAGEAYNTGWDAENIGYFSTAFGQGTIASGHVSTALGVNNIASGTFSFAAGAGSTASGNSSIAMGVEVIAVTRNETAIGSYTTNYTPSSIDDWVGTDRLFSIGNGFNGDTRSNALTVLKNGNTGIGIDNPENKLEVAGQVKIIGGNPGEGKVLTSNAEGLASWETPAEEGFELPYSGTVDASTTPAFKIVNTGFGEGIYGESSHLTGVIGVTHGNNCAGLKGIALASTVSSYAVRGENYSADGYSGYFNGGKFYVNGNVGIGNSNPANALSVTGQADISSRLVVGGSTQAGRLLVANADGAGNAFKIGTTEGDYGNLYFLSSGLIFDCYRASDARRQPILFQPNGGKIGVGTTNPAYTLDVTGDIRATGSVYYGGTAGSANGTPYNKPDFVFEENYQYLSIEEVSDFLEREKHLPWITSARQEKEENGDVIDMTRMAFETLETVENLQLQIISLQKVISELQTKNENLKAERELQKTNNSILHARLERLEKVLESLIEK